MRSIVFVVGVLVALTTACADDGNDAARNVASRNVASAYAASGSESEADASTSVAEAVDRAARTSVVDTTPDEPAVAPTGVVVPVIALDNSFRPEIVEVSVGDEVEWENRGINEHNVLRVEGEGWGVEVTDFQPGDVYSHVFSEPGEYRYYCSIHGNTEVGMVGTVLVRG